MILKEVKLVTVDNENYIISDESDSELFVFSIDDKLTVAYFDELLGAGIQWARPVLIEPEAIGWVNEGVNTDGLHMLTVLSERHLDTIRLNNGMCKIEVEELDTSLIQDFDPLINMSFTPIYHQSKVIIHL